MDLTQRILELRKAWPKPESCEFARSLCEEKLMALFESAYKAGIKVKPPAKCSKPYEIFKSPFVEDGVLADTWQQFHDALNDLETAITEHQKSSTNASRVEWTRR